MIRNTCMTCKVPKRTTMLKELIRQAKQCKCEHIISVLYDEDSIIVGFAVKYERLQHSIIRLSIFTTIWVPFFYHTTLGNNPLSIS